jgi:hypothetical protein
MTFAAWMGPEILAPALGDAPQDGSATGAVPPWNETKPRAEVSTTFEKRLAGADGGRHGGRDQWADAENAHEAMAVGFLFTDLLDLVGKGLDPLVEICPVIVETDTQIRAKITYALRTSGILQNLNDEVWPERPSL